VKPRVLSPAAVRAIAALALFYPTAEQAQVLLSCYARRSELTPDDWRAVIAAFRPTGGRAA
jgi:hypothetical protein